MGGGLTLSLRATLLQCLVPTIVGPSFNIPVPGEGYRNGCTTNCALLIMLHGFNSNGPEFRSEGITIHTTFQGIVAFPTETTSGQSSWPTNPGQSHWAANLQVINQLIAMPEVDSSNVYLTGYSNGGFFTYALSCAIGNQLRAVVVLAGLMDVQSCPQRTNVLHLHNTNDNTNPPADASGGSKGGTAVSGTPTSLRTAWLDASTYPGGTTNGASGSTTGAFTLYSASQGAAALTFEYWSYVGPSEHSYMVYTGTPYGCPQGVTQETYMANFFQASTPSSNPQSCAAHPGCSGLSGNCCPPDTGSNLACCTSAPSPPSPPPPSPPPPASPPPCQSWCAGNPAEWARKCNWGASCAGCAPCYAPFPSPSPPSARTPFTTARATR